MKDHIKKRVEYMEGKCETCPAILAGACNPRINYYHSCSEILESWLLSLEKVKITRHKLSCLIEAAAQDCAMCPAYDTCENTPDSTCDEVFDKWLEED